MLVMYYSLKERVLKGFQPISDSEGHSGTIKLHGKSNVIYLTKQLDILVDGMKIGEIANGQEERFEVVPGRHTVQVTAFIHYRQAKRLSRSESVEVYLSANNSIELECGVSPRFWKLTWPLSAIMFMFVFGNTFFHFGWPGLAVIFISLIPLSNWYVDAACKTAGAYYLKIVDAQPGK